MASELKAGDRAPDFTLPSTQGEVTLAARLADRPVLLVFYPGDDTPVCTKQLCNYRDNLSVFSDLDVDVLAINPQSLDSHERFAKKHSLPFPILADTSKKVCNSYGAIGLLGAAKRALVLIGRDGKVKWAKSDWPIFHQSAQEIRDAIGTLDLS